MTVMLRNKGYGRETCHSSLSGLPLLPQQNPHRVCFRHSPFPKRGPPHIPTSMSTSECIIDPALRDHPRPLTAFKSPRKRVARKSVSDASTILNASRSPGARVTRRSAASSHARENDEPTRGEEENLLRYTWGGSDGVSLLGSSLARLEVVSC